MFIVENSAVGNCMYEAYSISLMYFLRSRNQPHITNAVLNKFRLTELEKNSLISLITTNPDQEFSKDSIRQVIEPILARKARALAADQTRAEFIAAPMSTPLFSSAQYGFEFFFKMALAHHSKFQWLEKPPHNRNLTDAEIYKIENIQNLIFDFVKKNAELVHNEFELEWIKIKDTTKEDAITFEKNRLMGLIISKKTVEFFTINNHQHLKAYIRHIATDRVWGTEETLLTLHRAVQGEQLSRSQEGTIEASYDTEINLQIYINGRPSYDTYQPDMILNNINNGHWNSVIPNHIFDREAHHSRQDKGLTQETGTDLAVAQQLATNDTCLRIAPQEQQIEQDRVLAITSQQEIIADEQMLQQQTNNNQQTALTPLNDEHQTIPLKYDDTQPLALQIAENPQFIATNNRLDHLMRNLFDKIQSLNSRADLSNDPQQEISLRTACEKVSSLHNSLETAIKTYRQHPNQTTFERFKRTCHTSIEESRPILEIHRGLKQLLANIALAILGCGIIYLIAGAIHKACTNRFLFFRTDSEKLLDNIQQTIQKIEPPQSGEGALEK